MRVSRVLDLCTHPTVHLGRLELGKQLVHCEGLILFRLKSDLDLLTPHGMIQRMQELDSSVMIIVREHDHINPHVVHNHSEPLEHGIYGLTRDMREVPSGRSQRAKPKPEHSQHVHSIAAAKSCTPSPLSQPDRIRIDTEHDTSG
jgi:hypothetical protein